MFVGSDIAKLFGRLQNELEAASRVIQNLQTYANSLVRRNSELAFEVEGCLEGIKSRDSEIAELDEIIEHQEIAIKQQSATIQQLAEKVNTLGKKLGVLELSQLVTAYKNSLSEGDYTRLLAKADVVRTLVNEIEACLNNSLKN
jgi:chromosome segregation ATPase